MGRANAIGLTSIVLVVLLAIPGVQPLADGYASSSRGFRSYAPGQYGAPRYAQPPRAQRPQYSHGVPFLSRRESRAPRVYGRPGRHVISPGCGPVTRRSYDRHGNLVLRHLSLCYDRFGRSYTLGDRGGYRRR